MALFALYVVLHVVIRILGCNSQICTNSSSNCAVNCKTNECSNQALFFDDTPSQIDIHCNGTSSCEQSTLYLDYCKDVNLYCDEGCVDIKIISNNSMNLSIYCNNCQRITVYSFGDDPPLDSHINIFCQISYACNCGRFFYSSSNSIIHHSCHEVESCRNTLISAVQSKELEINVATNVRGMNVYPPLLNRFILTFANGSTSQTLYIFHPNPSSSNVEIECSHSNADVYMVYGLHFNNFAVLNRDNNCTLNDSTLSLDYNYNYIYGDDINYPTSLNAINSQTLTFNSTLPTLIFIPMLTDLSVRIESFVPSSYFTDLVIICIDNGLYALACQSSQYDFSSTENVTFLSNQLRESTIYGPINSFTSVYGNGAIYSNSYYFNNTKHIDFPCIECGVISWQWGKLMTKAYLYVGNQTETFHIQCKYYDCHNSDFYIDLNPLKYPIKSVFNLFDIDCSWHLPGSNCKNLTLHFPSENNTFDLDCAYNDTYQCPEYLLSANPTTQPTIQPSTAPTALIECYNNDNNTYHCETYCKSNSCINYIDDTADIYDLYCYEDAACYKLELTINNSRNVNIFCNGTDGPVGAKACEYMTIQTYGAVPSNINIHCNSQLSCAYSTIILDNPLSNLSTYCDGQWSCIGVVIYAIPVSELYIYCGFYACWDLYIYAPILQFNSSLNLYLTYGSVRNTVIYHPNIFSSNCSFNVECTETDSLDCLVYRSVQSLFLIYGKHLNQYCDYFRRNECEAPNADYIDIHYVYANLQDYPSLNLINNQTYLYHQTNTSNVPVMIFIPNTRNEIFTLSANFKNIEVVIVSHTEMKQSVFDFSLVNNIVFAVDRIQEVTIYGPTNSFEYMEWFGYSINVKFYLNETKSINIPCLCCPVTSTTAGNPPHGRSYATLYNSQLYIGNSVDFHINCDDNHAIDCDYLDVYSDLQPQSMNVSLISHDYWDISCNGVKYSYNQSGQNYFVYKKPCQDFYFHFANTTCKFNETDQCSRYLWTFPPTNSPTTVTVAPSRLPTTAPTFFPSKPPSPFLSTSPITSTPTFPPTTSEPTKKNLVNFEWIYPSITPFTIGDVFSRIQAKIQVVIKDGGVNASCDSCFSWYLLYYDQSINAASDDDWVLINAQSNNNVVVYTVEMADNVYESTLIISSIRNEYIGYGVDTEQTEHHILQPNSQYAIRLVLKNQGNDEQFASQIIATDTNSIPTNGDCNILNFDDLYILNEYSVQCDKWIINENNNSLSYNMLIEGLIISPYFTTNISYLTGLVPIGEMEIVILIQDEFGAKTAYPMNIVFPDIDHYNISVSHILDLMENILDDDNIAQDEILVLYIIIDNLFNDGLVSKSRASEIVRVLYNIVIAESKVLNEPSNVNYDELNNEVALLIKITSNYDMNNSSVILIEVIEDFLVNLFNIVLADISTYTSEQLFSIVVLSQTLIINLENTVLAIAKSENIDAEYINEITNILIEFELYLVHLALMNSIPGERFDFHFVAEDYTKHINGLKFQSGKDIDYNYGKIQYCGFEDEIFSIPSSFIENNNGIFDCTFSTSTMTNFITKNENYRKLSNIVNINIYDASNSESNNSTHQMYDIQHLSYDYTIHDECSPYVITFNLKNETLFNQQIYSAYELDKPGNVPYCGFWDIDNKSWNDNNCYFKSINDTIIECACYHTTSFQLSIKDFIPQANLVTHYNLRQLTIENLLTYPTVWITLLCILFVFIIVCLVNPKKSVQENPSILAYKNIIFKTFKDDKLNNDVIGNEIKHIHKYATLNDQVNDMFGQGLSKFNKKNICILQLKLFLIYLCNDHQFLSVFQRTSGTNFSTKERLSCLFLYWSTIIVSTAVFYGVENKVLQDIAASFLISLFGKLPVRLIKMCFTKSKPKQIERTKEYTVREHSEFDELQKQETLKTQKQTTSIFTSLFNTTVTGETEGEKQEKNDEEEFEDEIEENEFENYSKNNMSTFYSALNTFDKYTKYTKQETIHTAIEKVKNSDSMVYRIKLVEHIRSTLFNEIYPFPSCCKKVAWIFLVVWTTIACLIAIIYGLSFDLIYNIEPVENYDKIGYNNTCLVENNQMLQIENRLTQEYIAHKQHKFDDYFTGTTSDSGSFLLNILFSILLSMCCWQPLTIYVTTWLKLWAFSWNLRLRIGPSNLFKLCKRCCGKDKIYNKWLNKENDNKERNDGNQTVLTNKNRPLDIVGYFANDELFLKLKQIENDGLEENITPKYKLAKTVDIDGNNFEFTEQKQIDSIKLLTNKSISAYSHDDTHHNLVQMMNITSLQQNSNNYNSDDSDDEKP